VFGGDPRLESPAPGLLEIIGRILEAGAAVNMPLSSIDAFRIEVREKQRLVEVSHTSK
jgi:hypothetical protein